MPARTIENIAYDLKRGIVDDVQNHSETAVWGGGGGGSVVNGQGSFSDVVINSQTEHWKQVRISWDDGGRSSVNLPGHVSAVAGDQVEVLFASIPGGKSIGATAFHNKAENQAWWWSEGERILSDRDLADRYVPNHSRKSRFSMGIPLSALAILPGLFFVLGGMAAGEGIAFFLGLALCAPSAALWAMNSEGKASETRFGHRLARTAKALINDFEAKVGDIDHEKPANEKERRRAIAQALAAGDMARYESLTKS
jgi:hypothetical protein